MNEGGCSKYLPPAPEWPYGRFNSMVRISVWGHAFRMVSPERGPNSGNPQNSEGKDLRGLQRPIHTPETLRKNFIKDFISSRYSSYLPKLAA